MRPCLEECLADGRPLDFFPVATHVGLPGPRPPFRIIFSWSQASSISTLSSQALSRWASSLFSLASLALLGNRPIPAAQAFDPEGKAWTREDGFSEEIKL